MSVMGAMLSGYGAGSDSLVYGVGSNSSVYGGGDAGDYREASD